MFCPECGRKKAKSAGDAIKGYCPKWWAVMDSKADDDCNSFAEKLKKGDTTTDNIDMKETITDEIKDLVTAFLYYDRKEDESLPVGEIENEVKIGTISIDDMIETFKNELIKGIK